MVRNVSIKGLLPFRWQAYLDNIRIRYKRCDTHAMHRNSGRWPLSESLHDHAIFSWQFSRFLVFF
ncbi:hypothetical protein BGK60_01855 [Tannerella forsythia]|nr:hypothetical protein BGK60_01855 [Tannerella forsythia]